MAYASGDRITASDYNNFVNRINKVWNVGYGQTALPTITPNTIVTEKQWDDIVDIITRAGNHQGTTLNNMFDRSGTTLPGPTKFDVNTDSTASRDSSKLIHALNAIDSNISLLENNVLSTTSYTDTVLNSTDNFRIAVQDGDTGSGHVFSITFPNTYEDGVSEFFNTGGQIRLKAKVTLDGDISAQESGFKNIVDGRELIIYGDTSSGLNNINYLELASGGAVGKSFGRTVIYRNFPFRISGVYNRLQSRFYFRVEFRRYGLVDFSILYNTLVTIRSPNTDNLSTSWEFPTFSHIANDFTNNIVPVTSVNPDIVLESSSITVTEGSTTDFRVKLSEPPNNPVTIRASESDLPISLDGRVGASTDTRTFTSSNWNTYQSFTVTGLQDTNSVNNAATVSLTAIGGSTDTASVSVTIIDDDTVVNPDVEFVSYPIPYQITEGESIQLTLKLAEQPNSNVTVRLTTVGNKISISPSSRRFTTSNWNTPQAFTITANAIDRDTDAGILIRASGGSTFSYLSIISLIDSTVNPDIVVSTSSVNFFGTGGGKYIRVWLSERPDTNVTITASGVTVNPTTTTIIPSEWNLQHPIYIYGWGNSDWNGTLTLTASGGSTDTATVSVRSERDYR